MARATVLFLALSLLSGSNRNKRQIVIKANRKRKGLPTTTQASMVMAQARITGKTVSFAKY